MPETVEFPFRFHITLSISLKVHNNKITKQHDVSPFGREKEKPLLSTEQNKEYRRRGCE